MPTVTSRTSRSGATSRIAKITLVRGQLEVDVTDNLTATLKAEMGEFDRTVARSKCMNETPAVAGPFAGYTYSQILAALGQPVVGAEQYARLQALGQRRHQPQRFGRVRPVARLAPRRPHADVDLGLFDLRVRRALRLRLHRRQHLQRRARREVRPVQPGNPPRLAGRQHDRLPRRRVLRRHQSRVSRLDPDQQHQRARAADQCAPAWRRHDDRRHRHAARVRTGHDRAGRCSPA